MLQINLEDGAATKGFWKRFYLHKYLLGGLTLSPLRVDDWMILKFCSSRALLDKHSLFSSVERFSLSSSTDCRIRTLAKTPTMTEEVEVNQTPAAEPEPEPAVEPQVEVDSGEPVSISVETHVALFASVKETVFVC